MKKIVISLAALAALSTASFAAGNRSWDLQDREFYNTSGVSVTQSGAAVAASPLAIGGSVRNFDRLNMTAQSQDVSHN